MLSVELCQSPLARQGDRIVSRAVHDNTLRLWDFRQATPVGTPFEGHQRSGLVQSPLVRREIALSRGAGDNTLTAVEIWQSNVHRCTPFEGHS